MQKISRKLWNSRQRRNRQPTADSAVFWYGAVCAKLVQRRKHGAEGVVLSSFFRVESVDSVGPSLDCFTQKATDNPGQLKSIVMFWLALQRLSILQWSALWHLFSRPCIFDARLKMKTIHSRSTHPQCAKLWFILFQHITSLSTFNEQYVMEFLSFSPNN